MLPTFCNNFTNGLGEFNCHSVKKFVDRIDQFIRSLVAAGRCLDRCSVSYRKSKLCYVGVRKLTADVLR